MKELLKRLTLPTPVFFKKVQKVGLVLIAIGGGIAFMDIEGSIILDFLKPFAKEFIVAGTVMGFVAQSAAKPEVQNSKLEEVENG